MKKIAGLLEKRTEGIMNANRRNYYGEYTVYIASKNAYSGRRCEGTAGLMSKENK